ncbi:MAG TPA: diacylglycerol kinase family protein [Clostridia bacterium]
MSHIGSDPAGTLVFLINPAAGKASGQRHLRVMLAALEEQTAPGRILQVVTEAPGHATVLAEELAHRIRQDATLFICGGDGTVHEAINGLMAAGADAMPFAVIPTGTGNDFARHLYGRQDASSVLTGLMSGTMDPTPVDVVRAHGSYYINVMSFGLDTRVQMINEHLAEKAAFLGESTFMLSSLAGLLGRRSFRMRLEAEGLLPDGKIGAISEEFDYILMAVCNAEYYGGGFHPVPGAVSVDGWLEICHVDTMGLPGILRMLPKYRKGTHLGHPSVHRMTVRKGTLTSLDAPLPLLGNMDGEVFTTDRMEFECIPSALRVYRSAPPPETVSL